MITIRALAMPCFSASAQGDCRDGDESQEVRKPEPAIRGPQGERQTDWSSGNRALKASLRFKRRIIMLIQRFAFFLKFLRLSLLSCSGGRIYNPLTERGRRRC